MKVVHLSSADFWDQGILAYRIFKSTLNYGVNSLFITLMKHSGDPRVKSIIQDPVFKDKVKIVDEVSFNMPTPFFSILEMWRSKFGFRIMEKEGNILVSLPSTTLNIFEIREIQEADIIHIHWAPGIIDYNIAPIYLLDKPIVITCYDESIFTGICHITKGCYGYLDGCINCPLLDGDSKKLAEDAFKIKTSLYELLDVNLVVQNTFFEKVAQEFSIIKNIKKINPIASPFVLKNRLNKKIARETLGLNQKAKIFLCVVTSFSKQTYENLNMFLDSISSIKDEIKTPYVIIIGDGADQIEQRPGLAIHRLPEIPHEEALTWYYSAADIFLCPYEDNQISIYPIDAMACGLPILGFKSEVLKDIVDHTKNGYLVNIEQKEDIINGLKTLILNDQRKFAKIAKSKAKKFFLFERQGEQYVKLYKSLLEKRKKINVQKFISLGEQYYMENNKDLALILFKKLSNISPHNAEVVNNLGVIYWESKEPKKAYEYFKKAFQIDPENKDIRQNYENAKKALNL